MTKERLLMAGFEDINGFELTDKIREAFKHDGIDTPTPVQLEAIVGILEGRHAVLQSGTGTGKTLAYLLPLLQRLQDPASGRVVVITPATELAMQIARAANDYRIEAVTVATATSSAGHGRQKQRITKSTRLVIGTPGRILELYAARKMKGVQTMVLDEPDPVLNAKGGDYLREILSRPEPKVQLIMVAATFGPASKALVQERMGEDYIHIQPKDNPLHSMIAHHFVSPSGNMGKDVCLARFIEENKCKKAIVFVNQPDTLRHLFRYLNEHNLKTVTLSKDRSKNDRQNAVKDMALGKARILVTTDAAARGLDFPNVPWVFHYDLPSSPEAYVHRAGRTGRAGKTGQSVSLVTDKSRSMLKRFSKILEIECTPFQRHG